MAQQAQQSASSARAAVAAFSAVSAAVVPVSQVTANRTRLARLLATNILGVNLPAIALTEDQYQAMWANNSAAMSRYQAASAQATTTLPQVLFAALDYQSNWAGRSGQGDAHHRRRRSDQPRLREPDERLFRSGQPVGEPVHFVRISL